VGVDIFNMRFDDFEFFDGETTLAGSLSLSLSLFIVTVTPIWLRTKR